MEESGRDGWRPLLYPPPAMWQGLISYSCSVFECSTVSTVHSQYDFIVSGCPVCFTKIRMFFQTQLKSFYNEIQTQNKWHESQLTSYEQKNTLSDHALCAPALSSMYTLCKQMQQNELQSFAKQLIFMFLSHQLLTVTTIW